MATPDRDSLADGLVSIVEDAIAKSNDALLDELLSRQAVAKMDDGTERLMKAGDFFYLPPGHDSWVVGEEPYISLHILGSEGYATPPE